MDASSGISDAQIVEDASTAGHHCQNLLSLRLALAGDSAGALPDCDTPLLTPSAESSCNAGETAHQCANRLWDTPTGLSTPADTRPLVAQWAPRCRDGSDSCGIDNEVRCSDGSRPIYWMQLASPASDAWIVRFRGGVAARRSVTEDGIISIGEFASQRYFSAENGPDMTSLGQPDQNPGNGTMDPDGPFGGFNRVFIHKCSFDRYMGDVLHSDQNDVNGNTFDIYFYGRRVIEAVMNDLSNRFGLDAGDAVVLHGSSAGAASVIMNVDWIAETVLRPIVGSTGDIRAILDSYLMPGAELEGKCATETCAPGASTPNIFDYANADSTSVFTGVSPWGRIDTYDPTPYASADGHWRSWHGSYEGSRPFGDASCFAIHAGDTFPCYSETHVAMHHITTPLFVAHSISDSARSTKTIGFNQDDGPGLPEWDAAHYGPRVVSQLLSLARDGVDGGQRSEAFDTTHVANPLGFFMLQHTQHVLLNDADFPRCTLDPNGAAPPTSMADAILAWLAGSDVRVVEGINATRVGACPP